MVNKENMTAYVANLRTTEIPQTWGYLSVLEGCEHVPMGMCCLGILADMVPEIKKTVGDWDKCATCDAPLVIMQYGEEENASVLPAEALEWAGLSSTVPDLHAPLEALEGTWAPATYLNDARRMPFREIGDAFAETFLK